jgi:uncharacterized coiled-coil protein SlyX
MRAKRARSASLTTTSAGMDLPVLEAHISALEARISASEARISALEAAEANMQKEVNDLKEGMHLVLSMLRDETPVVQKSRLTTLARIPGIMDALREQGENEDWFVEGATELLRSYGALVQD